MPNSMPSRTATTRSPGWRAPSYGALHSSPSLWPSEPLVCIHMCSDTVRGLTQHGHRISRLRAKSHSPQKRADVGPLDAAFHELTSRDKQSFIALARSKRVSLWLSSNMQGLHRHGAKSATYSQARS